MKPKHTMPPARHDDHARAAVVALSVEDCRKLHYVVAAEPKWSRRRRQRVLRALRIAMEEAGS